MFQEKRGLQSQAERPRKFLIRLCGRDPDLLAHCPSDEHGASEMLGVSLLAGMAIHATFMIAALTVVNVPLLLAAAFGVMTAAGVFAADRMIMQGNDISRAEDCLRRIGATDIPKLSTNASRIFGRLLRTAFSLVTAVVLAGLVGVYLHEADIQSLIEARQIEMDRDVRQRAEEALDTERSRLEVQVLDADALVAGAVKLSNTRTDQAQVAVTEAKAEIARLQREADAARVQIQTAKTEEAEQRDLAQCELTDGTVPGCELASGIPKPGPRYRLALERAAAAAVRAKEAEAILRRIETKLAAARSRLAAARRSVEQMPDSGVAAAQEKRSQAIAALAAHDRGRSARLEQMVKSDPSRVALDPDSLATRIWALGELAHDVWFLAALVGIKLVAFALEMLPVIVSTVMAPGEYALLRGRLLAEQSRQLVRHRDAADMSDLELMLAAHRARSTAAAEIRPQTAEMGHLRDAIRAEELRSEMLRKRRSNEWFEFRSNPSSSSRGDQSNEVPV